MKIAVCFKIIPDEQEIKVGPDRTIDVNGASLIISPYDCNAIEAAMKLAEAVGDSSVVAVTAGGDKVENSKMKKAALSRGPTEMVAVKDAGLDCAGSYVVAKALKEAIEQIKDVDLVICGEGSGDMYCQQTGNILGAIMGLPAINAVSKITPADGKLVVERTVEDGVDVFEVSLPAVLTVTGDIFPVRIPSMKDILGAGKKPCTVIIPSDISQKLESETKTISILAPEQADRKQIIVNGDADEAIQEFFENIRKVIR